MRERRPTLPKMNALVLFFLAFPDIALKFMFFLQQCNCGASVWPFDLTFHCKQVEAVVRHLCWCVQGSNACLSLSIKPAVPDRIQGVKLNGIFQLLQKSCLEQLNHSRLATDHL